MASPHFFGLKLISTKQLHSFQNVKLNTQYFFLQFKIVSSLRDENILTCYEIKIYQELSSMWHFDNGQ